MAAQVPASDSGTVTPTAMVGVRRRRNRNTTSITSTTVAPRVSCMSRTLARIIWVRSDSTENWTSGGIQRLSSGSSAWMRSTVSITLASACLVIWRSTAGWRLYQAAERLLRVDCSMVAIEPSSVTAPFADLTTMSRYSRGSRICALVAMTSATPSLSNTPERPGGIGVDDGEAHVLEIDAHGGDRHRIDPHPDRRLLGAVHRDLGDAVDLRDALGDDGVGDVVDRARPAVYPRSAR